MSNIGEAITTLADAHYLFISLLWNMSRMFASRLKLALRFSFSTNLVSFPTSSQPIGGPVYQVYFYKSKRRRNKAVSIEKEIHKIRQ